MVFLRPVCCAVGTSSFCGTAFIGDTSTGHMSIVRKGTSSYAYVTREDLCAYCPNNGDYHYETCRHKQRNSRYYRLT